MQDVIKSHKNKRPKVYSIIIDGEKYIIEQVLEDRPVKDGFILANSTSFYIIWT